MAALKTDVWVGVVGAGAMGAGIAQVALDAGHGVVLFDAAPAALERARLGLATTYAKLAAKGKISAQQGAERLARLSCADKVEALAQVGLVIEAIVENLEIKAGVLARIEAQLAPHAIVATNTSSLSITAIAAKLQRPQRVVGMHFFNPAPLLPLVEVVAGKASDADALQTVFDTALAWGKAPVACRSTPGFIVNRIARPFYGEALRLLGEGAADAATLDLVLRECGAFRMGAFELMDMIGHDVNYAVTCSVYDAMYQDGRYQPSLLQKELVDAGWLGRKSGRGFYRYDGGQGGAAAASATSASATTGCATVPSASKDTATATAASAIATAAAAGTSAAPPAGARDVLRVEGDLGVARALQAMAADAGWRVSQQGGDATFMIDGVRIALTDGRSATARPGVDVVFDLACDYLSAPSVALAVADQAAPAALATATAFFQSLGKRVVVLDDAPGLVVMRTVAMLANEAAEAVQQSVATAADVDLAMTKGVNYPRGPLAWADSVGIAHICTVMENLTQVYGEDRYRLAPLLQRMRHGGRSFFAALSAPVSAPAAAPGEAPASASASKPGSETASAPVSAPIPSTTAGNRDVAFVAALGED